MSVGPEDLGFFFNVLAHSYQELMDLALPFPNAFEKRQSTPVNYYTSYFQVGFQVGLAQAHRNPH